MINWRSPPWQTGSGGVGGHRMLGVVTVSTDQGLDGHAFLGSSRQGADAFMGPLMEFVKPMLLGSNPLDEVFPCSGANKYGLVVDVEVDEHGLVYAPDKPDLGYDIDWELVEREKVEVVG